LGVVEWKNPVLRVEREELQSDAAHAQTVTPTSKRKKIKRKGI
jgi:hypothetical protein